MLVFFIHVTSVSTHGKFTLKVFTAAISSSLTSSCSRSLTISLFAFLLASMGYRLYWHPPEYLSLADPHFEKQQSIIRRLTCGTRFPNVMFVDEVGDGPPIDNQVDLSKKLRIYLSIGYGKICKR